MASVDWSASMITPSLELASSPLFRTEIEVDSGHGEVESAMLHISSLGVFEAAINGRPVGDDVLSPGWSSYEWRLRYRSYDIAPLFEDRSVITVSVGNGWYRGRLAFLGGRAFYGDQLGVIAQLEITFSDGHRQLVVTDEMWTAGGSDVIADDLYDGQTIDARRRKADWYKPGAKPLWFVRAKSLVFDTAKLTPSVGPAVTRQDVLKPVRIWPSPSAERSSTSVRTSSAGCGSPCAARLAARSESGMPRCSSTASSGSARSATSRRPTTSSSAAARTSSSRPRPSTVSATPRSPAGRPRRAAI